MRAAGYSFGRTTGIGYAYLGVITGIGVTPAQEAGIEWPCRCPCLKPPAMATVPTLMSAILFSSLREFLGDVRDS